MENRKTILINFNKENPKDNPIEYNMETIDDMFQILTEENIDRFFIEFKDVMLTIVQARTRVESNVEPTQERIRFKSYKWIDD